MIQALALKKNSHVTKRELLGQDFMSLLPSDNVRLQDLLSMLYTLYAMARPAGKIV